MRSFIRYFVMLTIGYLQLFSIVYAQLFKVETDHLILIQAGRSFDYLMPHVVRCYENAYAYHQKFFGFNPRERTTLFVQDFWDYGNAGATAIPTNYIRLGIAPLNYALETSPANERMNHTMNHELVHIVAGDKPAGSDHFFRSLFSEKFLLLLKIHFQCSIAI